MFRFFKKMFKKKNGKRSEPNLAVVFLTIIVIIQGILLLRVYHPKYLEQLAKSHTRPTSPAIKPPTPRLEPKPQPVPQPHLSAGKIALIIDDSGYSRNDCAHLAEIKVPVTISILPELPYSSATANCAFDQGKGVMLHLPLEPHVMKESYPDKYFIKTSLSEREILHRFTQAIHSVPHVEGVNNHEGSRATEDERVMAILYKEFARRDIFFVDSLVTSQSICRPLAHRVHLPFTSRDVFLDNQNTKSYIEEQFNILAQKARVNGTAVAIGHARTTSWAVMKEQIKKLTNDGFTFVTVPDIIEAQNN